MKIGATLAIFQSFKEFIYFLFFAGGVLEVASSVLVMVWGIHREEFDRSMSPHKDRPSKRVRRIKGVALGRAPRLTSGRTSGWTSGQTPGRSSGRMVVGGARVVSGAEKKST